jgi:nucleoid-associated protein YgaU
MTMTITGSSTALSDAAAAAPVDSAAFKAANDACTPILEAAGVQTGSSTIVSGSATLQDGAGGSGLVPLQAAAGAGVLGVATAGGDVTKMADDLKAFAACMRSSGIDMPDPVVDTKAGTVQLSMPGDPGSATFQAANKACATNPPFSALPAPAHP